MNNAVTVSVVLVPKQGGDHLRQDSQQGLKIETTRPTVFLFDAVSRAKIIPCIQFQPLHYHIWIKIMGESGAKRNSLTYLGELNLSGRNIDRAARVSTDSLCSTHILQHIFYTLPFYMRLKPFSTLCTLPHLSLKVRNSFSVQGKNSQISSLGNATTLWLHLDSRI